MSGTATVCRRIDPRLSSGARIRMQSCVGGPASLRARAIGLRRLVSTVPWARSEQACRWANKVYLTPTESHVEHL